MVQQRIAGRGFSAIADELNERRIPAPRGGKWHATTVGKILTSPMLLGHVVMLKGEIGVKGTPGYKKGQVVATKRGKDGQPVMFTDEPLIDDRRSGTSCRKPSGLPPAPRECPVAAHALSRAVLPVVLPQAI